MPRLLNVAVAGCSHGEMDRIYDQIMQFQHSTGNRVDLLICCGDFQSVRNHSDLKCMACPPKYRDLMTFHRYYSGEVRAPVLTLFVGGNHEASNYLAELPYGGWVAPNIYYLGYASVVRFGGLRIAGLTGIFNGRAYQKGHYEHPPFSDDTMRSFYHVRAFEIFRLKQLRSSKNRPERPLIDIGFSHDWPRGITDYGNKEQLIRWKRHLQEDIDRNQLGNPSTMLLIHELRPRYWFSAHLHVRFPATVPHRNPDVDDNPGEGEQPPICQTEFLALDKPVNNPNRKFLEFMQIESELDEQTAITFEYDPVWLAILRNTDALCNINNTTDYLPGPGSKERHDFFPSDEELDEVHKRFNSDFNIPFNFKHTAPPHRPNETARNTSEPKYYINSQTTEFCDKLGIININKEFYNRADPIALGHTEDEETRRMPADDNPPDFGADDFVLDTQPRNQPEKKLDDEPVNQMPDFVAPALKRPHELSDSETKDTVVGEKAKKNEEDDVAAVVPSAEADSNETPKVSVMSKFKRRNAGVVVEEDE